MKNLMTKNKEDFYTTYDLGCAAFLVAKDYKIEAIEDSEESSKRKVFYFDKDALEDGNDYWNNTAKVNPQKMSAAFKELKTRLYNL